MHREHESAMHAIRCEHAKLTSELEDTLAKMENSALQKTKAVSENTAVVHTKLSEEVCLAMWFARGTACPGQRLTASPTPLPNALMCCVSADDDAVGCG